MTKLTFLTDKDKELIAKQLTPVDTDAEFASYLEDIYPEYVDVGYLQVNTLDYLKNNDPIMWQHTKDEYVHYSLLEDDRIISLNEDDTYYWLDEVDRLVEKIYPCHALTNQCEYHEPLPNKGDTQ